MMLPATVYFADGDEDGGVVEVENVNFKDGGWVGLLTKDKDWVYYPPHTIDRIVSKKE